MPSHVATPVRTAHALVARLFRAMIELRTSVEPRELLASGANFEMTASGGVVHLTVTNPPNVDREEGARCAREMRETLLSRVLTVGSPYVGLVFDVRKGPEVFGPITRGMLEGIFRAAEASQRRIAVRVGSAATQRLQFSNLCRECAPRFSKVVDSDAEQGAWTKPQPAP